MGPQGSDRLRCVPAGARVTFRVPGWAGTMCAASPERASAARLPGRCGRAQGRAPFPRRGVCDAKPSSCPIPRAAPATSGADKRAGHGLGPFVRTEAVRTISTAASARIGHVPPPGTCGRVHRPRAGATRVFPTPGVDAAHGRTDLVLPYLLQGGGSDGRTAPGVRSAPAAPPGRACAGSGRSGVVTAHHPSGASSPLGDPPVSQQLPMPPTG